ncbi:hypothetical protein HDV00_003292 [Rhizophlyctis rosea]|nr:hypothetical protein HDV00_003292 [Rhizophlyctis rosea]
MTQDTVYFVTGANRGLGLGLVTALSKRPNTIVFATARDPSKAIDLQALAKTNPNLHIIKLEVTSVEDTKAAADYVSRTTGGIDVVIANAGIADSYYPITKLPPQVLDDHLKINTLGPLILFQALYPLLLARQTRKFIPISTPMGTITTPLPVPNTAYGASKVAANFITRHIHREHTDEGFIVFPLSPGWVQTEMGQKGVDALKDLPQVIALMGNLDKPPVTVEQSVEGQLKIIDGATKDDADKFWSFDGTTIAW